MAKHGRRRKSSGYKWLAVVLAAGVAVIALLIPGKESEYEKLQEEYTQADSEYQAAQENLNDLQNQLDHISDTSVIERIARRNSDCGWMGEVIYDVENLDSVKAELYPEEEK